MTTSLMKPWIQQKVLDPAKVIARPYAQIIEIGSSVVISDGRFFIKAKLDSKTSLDSLIIGEIISVTQFNIKFSNTREVMFVVHQFETITNSGNLRVGDPIDINKDDHVKRLVQERVQSNHTQNDHGSSSTSPMELQCCPSPSERLFTVSDCIISPSQQDILMTIDGFVETAEPLELSPILPEKEPEMNTIDLQSSQPVGHSDTHNGTSAPLDEPGIINSIETLRVPLPAIPSVPSTTHHSDCTSAVLANFYGTGISDVISEIFADIDFDDTAETQKSARLFITPQTTSSQQRTPDARKNIDDSAVGTLVDLSLSSASESNNRDNEERQSTSTAKISPSPPPKVLSQSAATILQHTDQAQVASPQRRSTLLNVHQLDIQPAQPSFEPCSFTNVLSISSSASPHQQQSVQQSPPPIETDISSADEHLPSNNAQPDTVSHSPPKATSKGKNSTTTALNEINNKSKSPELLVSVLHEAPASHPTHSKSARKQLPSSSQKNATIQNNAPFHFTTLTQFARHHGGTTTTQQQRNGSKNMEKPSKSASKSSDGNDQNRKRKADSALPQDGSPGTKKTKLPSASNSSAQSSLQPQPAKHGALPHSAQKIAQGTIAASPTPPTTTTAPASFRPQPQQRRTASTGYFTQPAQSPTRARRNSDTTISRQPQKSKQIDPRILAFCNEVDERKLVVFKKW